mgnify:CR=1 FL=1
MEKKEIEKQLNNFWNKDSKKNNQETEVVKMEEVKMQGRLQDIKLDNDSKPVNAIVKDGNIKDGSEYGIQIKVIDAVTQKGGQQLYIYQQIGRLFVSEGKTWQVDGECIINGEQKKIFGYENKKVNPETGREDEWIGLTIIPKQHKLKSKGVNALCYRV